MKRLINMAGKHALVQGQTRRPGPLCSPQATLWFRPVGVHMLAAHRMPGTANSAVASSPHLCYDDVCWVAYVEQHAQDVGSCILCQEVWHRVHLRCTRKVDDDRSQGLQRSIQGTYHHIHKWFIQCWGCTVGSCEQSVHDLPAHTMRDHAHPKEVM